MLKHENLLSTNSTKSGAHSNFAEFQGNEHIPETSKSGAYCISNSITESQTRNFARFKHVSLMFRLWYPNTNDALLYKKCRTKSNKKAFKLKINYPFVDRCEQRHTRLKTLPSHATCFLRIFKIDTGVSSPGHLPTRKRLC